MLEEAKIPTKRVNRMQLTDRKSLSLNGIIDVMAFDINEILLETDLGMLMIKGRNLHVNRLTVEKGEMDVEGQIDSLVYADGDPKTGRGESFLSRIFR